MENAEHLEKARERHLRCAKKTHRLKAQVAFLRAGGSRGEFARQWPSVYIEEARGHSGE